MSRTRVIITKIIERISLSTIDIDNCLSLIVNSSKTYEFSKESKNKLDNVRIIIVGGELKFFYRFKNTALQNRDIISWTLVFNKKTLQFKNMILDT